MTRGIGTASIASVLSLLLGCTVGPDFKRPEPTRVAGYIPAPPTETVSADTDGGEAQRFLRDLDIPGQWWTLFRSEPLNALIARALEANPNLQAAQSALRVAMENVYAQEGAYYPSVSANLSSSRQKTASSLSPTPASGATIFNLHTAQVSVSYMPDVFGLNRRTVEATAAQADAQRFQLEATYITLTDNVATAAVQEAALRAQIAATEEIIRAEIELVRLFVRQRDLGQVAGLDVAAQEAALAQAQATLPPLKKQLAQQRDLLIALAGGLPSEELAQKFDLASLRLPEDLPLSIPSRLIEQRPDLRQAEANLHAASAQVGVAIANRLPNVTLTADLGKTALDITKLFAPGSAFWTLAGSVTQPIFQGGALLHRERAARAALDQAGEQYRAAVVNAFQNVADTLYALQFDAEALKAALAAEQATRKTLDITRRQLELGAVNYLSLLTAEQSYLTAVVTLAQAKGNRYADTVALFQALGGGWWNRMDARSAVPATVH